MAVGGQGNKQWQHVLMVPFLFSSLFITLFIYILVAVTVTNFSCEPASGVENQWFHSNQYKSNNIKNVHGIISYAVSVVQKPCTAWDISCGCRRLAVVDLAALAILARYNISGCETSDVE
jgi:uncharacterized membrane protein